jgi:aromatic ring-opening dioxygenase LigB subunit
MIVFACISPHPPIILPEVGSPDDRKQVFDTISALNQLGAKLAKANPQKIVISSPHPDWGFNVPLHFLFPKKDIPTDAILTTVNTPEWHFKKGKEFFKSNIEKSDENTALIASGDLSHRLKTDGPYGLHPDGAKFDEALINGLKKKDLSAIMNLDGKYPEAGECGLRSFCFLLGILEAARLDWQIDILSYEAPFGVGYLVARLI